MTFFSGSFVTDQILEEMNLIVCRSCMIYFGQGLRDRVVNLFVGSLIKKGFLALGSKESSRFNKYYNLFLYKGYIIVVIVCFVNFFYISSDSYADVNQSVKQDGTFIFNIDNDAINSSDDNYTSGLQVGWLSGYLPKDGGSSFPEQVGSTFDGLTLIKRPGRQRYFSFSISQRLFTPTDISAEEAIPNDTPYLGLLLFSFTVCSQTEKRLGAFTFTTGLAGPLALGEETQTSFHHVIGNDRPRGWGNQIENEVILNFQYERRSRISSFGLNRYLKGDVIVPASLYVGNLLSMLTTGTAFRFGLNTPNDFFIPPPFFGEESVGGLPFDKKRKSSIYVFSMISGSLIGNAIFWDGNTFSDSASVDHGHLLGTLYTGVNVEFGHWTVTFTYVATSVPWETPDRRKFERYGHLSIRCRF